MKTEDCERYFEDPESHAAHLDTCEECRAFFGELDEVPAVSPVAVAPEALPLAPWEGARYRAWPLVAGVLLAVVAMVIALFLVAGQSPVTGATNAVSAQVPQANVLVKFFHLTGSAIPNAPTPWLIAIGISFVIVNTLLVILLRRPPRGLDA